MKVVFLDVDGVLNHERCTETIAGYTGVADDLVEKLAKIVHSTGSQIVLVSSWKTLWDSMPPQNPGLHPMALYLVRKLEKQQLHIADRTEEKTPAYRGHGIRAWIRKVRDVESWVVLDDEIFLDYEECDIMPHLVQTDMEYGLTDADVKKAIEILNRGN